MGAGWGTSEDGLGQEWAVAEEAAETSGRSAEGKYSSAPCEWVQVAVGELLRHGHSRAVSPGVLKVCHVLYGPHRGRKGRAGRRRVF